MPLRIAIIANIVPHYRKDFYDRIMASEHFRCTLFCQREVRGLALNSVHSALSGAVRELSYLALRREKLVWQRLPVLHLWRHFDVYVFYGNPRVLSTVVWASALRLARRKVIIWGQGHTAGASPLQERIRLSWWKLFDYFFVYTDREASLLRRRGFHAKRIVGMNNGLDQRSLESQARRWGTQRLSDWRKHQGLEGRLVILSCARLETKNRFDVMLRCMPALISAFDSVLWCVIGDGPAASELKARAKDSGCEGHVLWLGAMYDEEEIAPWFLISQCLIHPGAIGLSLLHAFGYGLPVITHDNAHNHMPEIAALRNGWNGLLYRENDPNALLDKIIALLGDPHALKPMRENARSVAATEFNTQIMASRFTELIRSVVNPAVYE